MRSYDSAPAPRRAERAPRPYDTKPEPRRSFAERRGMSSGGYGDSDFSAPRTRAARPTRSIGGYDPEFVVQTNINAARAPRPKTSLDFPVSREARIATHGTDARPPRREGERGGYAGRSSGSDRAPRSSDRGGDRGGRPVKASSQRAV